MPHLKESRLTDEQRTLIETFLAEPKAEGRLAGLVWRWARVRTGEAFEAARADAMAGVVQAALTYRPDLAASFATHAAGKIQWAIVDGLRRRMPIAASLDAMADGDRPMANRLAAYDGDPARAVAADEFWQWALDQLDERRGLVVTLHLLFGWSQARVTTELGISKQRVHQLYNDAIETLRRAMAREDGNRQTGNGKWEPARARRREALAES